MAPGGQWLRPSKMKQLGSQGGGQEGTAEGWPGQGRQDVTQAVRVASLGPPAHQGAPQGPGCTQEMQRGERLGKPEGPKEPSPGVPLALGRA